MPKNSEKNSVRWHSNPTCYQEEFFIKKGLFLAVQGTLNAIIWNFFVYECDHVYKSAMRCQSSNKSRLWPLFDEEWASGYSHHFTHHLRTGTFSFKKTKHKNSNDIVKNWNNCECNEHKIKNTFSGYHINHKIPYRMIISTSWKKLLLLVLPKVSTNHNYSKMYKVNAEDKIGIFIINVKFQSLSNSMVIYYIPFHIISF